MNCFTILRFKHCTTLNKSLIEHCLTRYVPVCQARFYVIESENRYRQHVSPNERAQRKPLRVRIVQNFKHTRRKVEEIIERENIWTIPNLLCMGRIITSPFLSYLILSQDYQVRYNILISLLSVSLSQCVPVCVCVCVCVLQCSNFYFKKAKNKFSLCFSKTYLFSNTSFYL